MEDVMNILFLGGDKRYKYMMSELADNHNVSQIGFEISIPKIHQEDINTLSLLDFDIVLFPISGISDNFEIKTETGSVILPKLLFENLNNSTKFFTGLKTKKLLEVIPSSQLISFLDDEAV